jgi:hypothetical protein
MVWAATNKWGTDMETGLVIMAMRCSGPVRPPVPWISGIAFGTDGTQQVGEGATGAALWSNTAASAVNLSPTNPALGITSSTALAVSGTQQVGYGSGTGTDNNYHALLWNGTADSAVDLNPTQAGFTSSFAYDTNGDVQVGYAYAGPYTAAAWEGSADSFINLQSLLPSDISWLQSTAYSIDSSGNIYGVGITEVDGAGIEYAVEWSPVPEPASASLLLIVGGAALLRRRRRAA